MLNAQVMCDFFNKYKKYFIVVFLKLLPEKKGVTTQKCGLNRIKQFFPIGGKMMINCVIAL